MRLKRMLATAGAVTPLFLGAVSPAHGCLVVPVDRDSPAADHSEQIDCGEVGCGPNAPFEGPGLHTAAEHSPQVEPEEGGMFVVPIGQ